MARTTTILSPVALSVCLAAATGCGDGAASQGPPRACGAATCSGIGTCYEEGGLAWCACPEGTHPEGLTCVTNNPAVPCDGVTCGDHGWCRVEPSGLPACECFDGYHPAAGGNLACVADTTPDAGPDVEGDGGDGDGPPDDADAEAGEVMSGDGDGDGDGEAVAEAVDDVGGVTCGGALGGPCHLSRQCGCAGGERCVVVVESDRFVERCTPAGSAAAGTACVMSADDCVAGSQCLAPFGQFACERFCSGPSDCPGTACHGGAFAGTLYGFCEPPVGACVPVTNFGCGAEQACRVIAASSLRTYCGSAGPGGEDAECLTAGCQGGFACHLLDVSNIRCRRYCLLSSPSCTTGSCLDVYGNGSVGLCL
jgi:hypothetical protein